MKTQKGFAHAFLIIGLILALVGALGFLFWQNFIYKESVATNEPIVTAKKDESKVKDQNQKALTISGDDYSFKAPEGFTESQEQKFTFTATLKAVKTIVNKEGDYFEVLTISGDGGYSADYLWEYTVKNGKLIVEKANRCSGTDFHCAGENDSIEGVISSQNGEGKYYFAFGNKTRNETDLVFVDEIVSTFSLK